MGGRLLQQLHKDPFLFLRNNTYRAWDYFTDRWRECPEYGKRLFSLGFPNKKHFEKKMIFMQGKEVGCFWPSGQATSKQLICRYSHNVITVLSYVVIILGQSLLI